MISAPDISSNAGNYRIAFQSEQVTFRVERISDKRDTVGEFTVHTQVLGLEPYIAGPEKVNLVSGRSQASFVKSCLENQPSLKDLEWDRILSKVCREVLKLHREGEPVITLAHHHPEDKLLRPGPTIWTARPSSKPYASPSSRVCFICALGQEGLSAENRNRREEQRTNTGDVFTEACTKFRSRVSTTYQEGQGEGVV